MSGTKTVETARRKRLPREIRREQVLATAARLIEEEGVGAVTMERVARREQVSKPTIYRYFPDRGHLLLALAQRYWDQLDAVVGERLRMCRTFEEQLEAVVSGTFDMIDESGGAAQILLLRDSHEPVLERARVERRREAEAQWSRVYQSKAALTKAEADALAAVLRSALVGAMHHWLSAPDTDRETCIRVTTTLVTSTLLALRPPRAIAKSASRSGSAPSTLL
jgi:AcrR family transcriptional regulator